MSTLSALTPAERLQATAARGLGLLGPAAKRRIAGAPIRLDGLELDLDVQVLIRLAERNPRAALATSTPARARADLTEGARVVAGPTILGVNVRETNIAGAAGDLRARLYSPADLSPGESAAMIVYYHGGGFVAGDLDTHDQPCRLLARTSGARVLSVDYRLAPENPFPAAVDDALAAFRDAVARDGAGGHLAAVTSQLAAADGGAAPAFQLLIYPVTDMTQVSGSRNTFADGFLLTKENMDWYEEQFLGPDTDRSDPRASPLVAADVSSVAPALVVTAGFDPLRDEGEAYAAKMRDAGVHTILRRHPGYVHGFIHFMLAGTGPREAVAEMGGIVRAALAT